MENTHPQVQKAADEVESWFRRFRDNSSLQRHLIISGPTGVGKSHLSVKLLKTVRGSVHQLWPSSAWNHPPSVASADFSKIAVKEESEWREWWKDHIDDIAGCGLQAEVLFLEDIGCEVDRYRSGAPAARLCEIFNWFAEQWLVVTTNVPPGEWKTRWDARVADRMLRNSVIVEMDNVPSFQISKPELKQVRLPYIE